MVEGVEEFTDVCGHNLTYALTYREALQIADELGWTKTQAWIKNKEYSTIRPRAELTTRLQPYRMTPDAWWNKVTRSLE